MSNPPGLPSQLSRPDAQLIIDALNLRLHALESEGAKPTGAAGGSLKGTYPNPGIAENAVGAPEITAGAVGSSELATGAKELFPQLATPASRKIAFGSVGLTVEGTEFTNGKEITHGLGTTPAAVRVSPTLTSGSAYVIINLSAVGATTFTVQGYIPQKTGVKGQTLTVYWDAIG